MDTNPYAPPQSLGTPVAAAGQPAPPYKLYSPRQVAVAAFLGAPVAGAWFISHNYRQWGNSGAAIQALIWGLLGTVVLMVGTFYLPENFPNNVIPIAYTLGMLYGAKNLQGAAVDEHTARGGQLGSWWAVVGVGFLCLIVIVLFVVAGVFLLMPGDAGLAQ